MTRLKQEQIIQVLHNADGELAERKAVEEICREEQINPMPSQLAGLPEDSGSLCCTIFHPT